MAQYRIRYSDKAKHLQLRLSAKGLEVVIPKRQWISAQQIDKFILEKASWIKKNVDRWAVSEKKEMELPLLIDLPAIHQQFEVQYLETHHAKLQLHYSQQTLFLQGDIKHKPACFNKLQQFLEQIALKHLPSLLRALSLETGLSFNNVSIRNNFTRWGSCSSKKNINLCCKLLFLPSNLVRHVLLHELCHTQILNHSLKFWQLLEHHDPLARLHAKELKIKQKEIPDWALCRAN